MLLAERHRRPRGRHVSSTRVRVQGGYQPSVVRGSVGVPLRIVFSREETASCSEHVVFPAFGLSAMLPPFEDVVLELVPKEAGEYEFTCQLGMLRGVLVVDDDTRSPTPPARRRRGSSGARFGALLVLATLLALIVLVVLLG
jgi:plastocyanin domain-containing protein